MKNIIGSKINKQNMERNENKREIKNDEIKILQETNETKTNKKQRKKANK